MNILAYLLRLVKDQRPQPATPPHRRSILFTANGETRVLEVPA